MKTPETYDDILKELDENPFQREQTDTLATTTLWKKSVYIVGGSHYIVLQSDSLDDLADLASRIIGTTEWTPVGSIVIVPQAETSLLEGMSKHHTWYNYLQSLVRVRVP